MPQVEHITRTTSEETKNKLRLQTITSSTDEWSLILFKGEKSVLHLKSKDFDPLLVLEEPSTIREILHELSFLFSEETDRQFWASHSAPDIGTGQPPAPDAPAHGEEPEKS